MSFLNNLINSLRSDDFYKKTLGLQNETPGEYKARLIGERGRLYGLLHNPSKLEVCTLTKEEIVQQMQDIGKKLDAVYEVQKAKHFLGREL